MNVLEAIQERRAIRKFLPKEIPADVLKKIVEAARLYPTGGNLQPLRFAVITDPVSRGTVFEDLRWAMYLPEFVVLPQEQPAAYIILLRDDRVRQKCDYDVGAASAMVMLAAVAQGLASCPIGNFRKTRIAELLQLDTSLIPELVVALGYPAQESRVIPMEDSVKYTEDTNGNLLVPKWNTEDVLAYFD
jgi:nitroreductase